MKIVIRPRRGGKTQTLLTMLRFELESVLVCASENEAVRLRRENPDIDPRRIIAFCNRSSLAGMRYHSVLLDNAEMMLHQLFTIPIDAISLTRND